MSRNNERGAAELRSSALWGTGNRGGDSRSSVLWGKGGRGIVTFLLVCALAAPLAATASPGKGNGATPPAPALPDPAKDTFVGPDLLAKAKNHPGDKVSVIIQSTSGVSGAEKAFKGLGQLSGRNKSLDLVGGIAVDLPAKLVEKLAAVPGLTVTFDSPVRLSGTVQQLRSTQLWPYESGNSLLWGDDLSRYAGKAPAIAVIDSGIQDRSDFGSRLVASVNLSSMPNNSAGDGRGHGTFVAGIAAGAAPDLAGAAPTAPLVSVDVMDDSGVAKTSDVISACQWVLENKGKYNIRVANLSLHSMTPSNFTRDPLDKAVEKLWFGGVTVVVAVGNYGLATGPSGVKYAPGNDPFVITVGAIDLGDSPRFGDDTVPSWSAYGYTYDGFYKPDVAAPGRYMVGPVPAGSTLTKDKAPNMVGTDRIQLSGTSFAAPVVAGTVAQMLARHPEWTPDTVKGVLMKTARRVRSNPRSAGMGEVTSSRAAYSIGAPNPNRGLDQFLTDDPAGGSLPVFDALSWASAARASLSWNALSWADLSWTDLSWADQSWASLSWADQSWSSLSWTDLSWADALSWADNAQADSSVEDAAEGDATSSDPNGYQVEPGDLAILAEDPGRNPPDATPAVDATGTVTAPAVDTVTAPTLP